MTSTSTDGHYCFDQSAPALRAHETLKNGWSQTAPGEPQVYYKITIDAGLNYNNADFGNVPSTINGGNGRDNFTIKRGQTGRSTCDDNAGAGAVFSPPLSLMEEEGTSISSAAAMIRW